MRRVLLTAATLLAPAALVGQESGSADARWQAWVGCWEPVGGVARSAVCVLPSGAAGVDLVTVAADSLRSRERIVADGEQRQGVRESCTGWDRARWSADGRRVYLRSEHRCDGVAVTSTGIMAMSPTGEWLDVRSVSLAGGPPAVQVRRFVALGDSVPLPRDVAAEVRGALAARPMMRMAARMNAASTVTTAEVLEAAREADGIAVEAWLVERGQRFAIDAKRLVALADAGVSERVIDVVVALSYPRRFAIGGRDPELRPDAPRPTSLNPIATSYGSRDDCYGTRYYSRYCASYSPYGWSGDRWAYGYNNGSGYYGGYGQGYGQTVIVIREPSAGGPSGRVVKGRGYSSGGATTGRSAEPRNDGSAGRDRATSTNNGSSGSGSSGGSGSTGSSAGTKASAPSPSSETGRTAKPRNP